LLPPRGPPLAVLFESRCGGGGGGGGGGGDDWGR